jgi:hypothetical protein
MLALTSLPAGRAGLFSVGVEGRQARLAVVAGERGSTARPVTALAVRPHRDRDRLGAEDAGGRRSGEREEEQQR